MRHPRKPTLNRRSFLNHAGRLGMTVAAGDVALQQTEASAGSNQPQQTQGYYAFALP